MECTSFGWLSVDMRHRIQPDGTLLLDFKAPKMSFKILNSNVFHENNLSMEQKGKIKCFWFGGKRSLLTWGTFKHHLWLNISFYIILFRHITVLLTSTYFLYVRLHSKDSPQCYPERSCVHVSTGQSQSMVEPLWFGFLLRSTDTGGQMNSLSHSSGPSWAVFRSVKGCIILHSITRLSMLLTSHKVSINRKRHYMDSQSNNKVLRGPGFMHLLVNGGGGFPS